MRFQSPPTVPAKRQRGTDGNSDQDSDMDGSDSPPPPKRSSVRPGFSAGRMTAKKGPDGPMKPNSFAAKMMAKMGYVAGQGLGTEGQGILNPVDTKLRPQGVGLGAVSEKTEQAKAEERRAAEARGETIHDSSEEERQRKRRQKKARASAQNGAGTPGGFTRPKTRYRTAAEIEEDAEGLKVPSILKTVIDATGREPKELSALKALSTQQFIKASAPETEDEKIAKKTKREIDHCVEEWTGLSETKKHIDLQEQRFQSELIDRQQGIARAQQLASAIDDLRELENLNSEHEGSSWNKTCERLQRLESDFEGDIERYNIQEIAVAAIYRVFKSSMAGWSPLEKPDLLAPELARIRGILGIRSLPDIQALTINGITGSARSSKNSTPYETLLYRHWLPRVRSAITNEWDISDSDPLISLMDTWKPLLPPFIFYSLIEAQIIPKLSAALSSWTPRAATKPSNPASSPHIYFFPWLAVLPAQYLDSESSTGLIADLKRALRTGLSKWDLRSNSILPGLEHYKSLLPHQLPNYITRYLLPRLSRHLREHLVIDPSDQKLEPLQQVMLWFPHLPSSTIVELLRAAFFPKWIATLHLWLTTPDVDIDETLEWLSWWKGRFTDETNSQLGRDWAQGRKLIDDALMLGDEAETKLALPSLPIHEVKNREKSTSKAVKTEAYTESGAKVQPVSENTTRDILEAWCEEESLVMIPMREAHADTGLPLFRITASANGKGGVVMYISGDSIWVQNRKDKSHFEIFPIGDVLLARIEGR